MSAGIRLRGGTWLSRLRRTRLLLTLGLSIDRGSAFGQVEKWLAVESGSMGMLLPFGLFAHSISAEHDRH